MSGVVPEGTAKGIFTETLPPLKSTIALPPFSVSLMSGVGENTFSPNANLSRAMLAQILYNLAGRPAATGASDFNDVAEGMWYTNAIAWAAENGVVSGLGNGKFGPNDNITREQLAVMLYRYAGSPAAGGRPRLSPRLAFKQLRHMHF